MALAGQFESRFTAITKIEITDQLLSLTVTAHGDLGWPSRFKKPQQNNKKEG